MTRKPNSRARLSSMRGATWQSSLAWRQGLTEIMLRWNGLLSLVWLFAAALAVGALLFMLLALAELTGVTILGSDAWFGSSPLKFVFAAAIYIGVIALGSHHLLSGLGLLARERKVLTSTDKKVAAFRSEPFISRETIFGRDNPFAVTGFEEITDAGQTATVKLVTAIHADASRDRFDPINLLVDRVGDQVLGGSAGIRDSQQLGVRLGILGTFTGILLSLHGVDGILSQDGDAANAVGPNISAIVTSLGGAFGTSIAGLLAAVLLQVMAGSLRGREGDVIERMHRVAAGVQGICLNAARDENPKKLEALLKGHRETISGFVASLDENGHRVETAVEQLAQFAALPLRTILDQTRELQAALDKQSVAIDHLGRIGETIHDLDHDLAASRRQGLEAFAAALDALTFRLIEEIRTGYGRDAQTSLESHLDRQAERQFLAVERMAGHFKIAMICSGLMLVIVVVAVSGGFERLAHVANSH